MQHGLIEMTMGMKGLAAVTALSKDRMKLDRNVVPETKKKGLGNTAELP